MRYAKVEDGAIQDTAEDPQALTDVALGGGPSMQSAQVYPIYKRGRRPATHPDVDVPSEERNGYTDDVQSGAVYRRAEYAQRPVQDYKDALQEKVAQIRAEKATAPVTYDGNEYDADSTSQQRIQGAIERAKAYNAKSSDTWSQEWKLADNSFTEVTQADLESVFGLVAQQMEAAYTREAELANAIGAAATINELNSIDVTAGWP